MHGNTAMAQPSLDGFMGVFQLFSRLLEHFGPQSWWPAETPWEMMVGAILTQNTAWTNVEKALFALQQAKALSVPAIARMPRRRLERLIRPSGYFRQKAKRLQLFAREMKRNPAFFRELCGKGRALAPCVRAGRSPLSRGMRERASRTEGTGAGEGIRALRQRLLSLHGIGPETADSILLYAGGYPIFVVDAYTRRFGQRMGLFQTDAYQEIQNFFEGSLPRKALVYNEFHALIVALAKNVCTSRSPKCPACPVSTLCVFSEANQSPR